MSRSAQVSYTGSGDYNKYVFTFTCICKPHRCYPGSTGPLSIDQAPVVQKLDGAIHRINHYPVDNAIGLPITYPLDSDLSGG